VRLRLTLTVALATSLAGCGIIEANVAAIETLADEDSTKADKGFATAVVGGTIAAIGALAVAGTISVTTGWSPDDPPPKEYVADELGWNLEMKGDEATWLRCTSRIFCTEERITVPREDLLTHGAVGRVVPIAMGGRTLGEVELIALKVRRLR